MSTATNNNSLVEPKTINLALDTVMTDLADENVSAFTPINPPAATPAATWTPIGATAVHGSVGRSAAVSTTYDGAAASGSNGFAGAGDSLIMATLAPSAPAEAATPAPTVTTIKSVAASAAAPIATTPAWMNSLATTSIQADVKAADVKGTIGYAGLEKVISDLDATLSATNSKLTSAEFADLKTLTANLNSGVSTSGYLTSVMGDIVNGNAANASWTGGAAKSVALGNLAVGASATQLAELNGSWLLGTDLPSSSVSMRGYSTFSVSYATSTAPLYAAAGPSISNINQGYLGDCYLLSSLGEVANQDSSLITNMITVNGNGTYGVRFFVNGAADYVTVDSQLADGGNIFNKSPDIWASIVETAYAEFQASGNTTGGATSAGDSFSGIGNGGSPEEALEEITGASQITDFDSTRSSWQKVTYNSNLAFTGVTMSQTNAGVLATLVGDLSAHDDVVLGSETNATDASGRTTLVASHAMSIYGYDSTTGLLEVRNPWGVAYGQTWDTTFEVSLNTLMADGDQITADNAGAATPASLMTASSNTPTPKLPISHGLAGSVSGVGALSGDQARVSGGAGYTPLYLSPSQSGGSRASAVGTGRTAGDQSGFGGSEHSLAWTINAGSSYGETGLTAALTLHDHADPLAVFSASAPWKTNALAPSIG